MSEHRPAANKLVERVNRVLLPMIVSSTKRNDHSDQDHCIADVGGHINSFVSKTTEFSPNQALCGYSLQFYNEGAIEIAKVTNNETWILPTEIREEICRRIIATQEKMKTWFDQKHYTALLRRNDVTQDFS